MKNIKKYVENMKNYEEVQGGPPSPHFLTSHSGDVPFVMMSQILSSSLVYIGSDDITFGEIAMGLGKIPSSPPISSYFLNFLSLRSRTGEG